MFLKIDIFFLRDTENFTFSFVQLFMDYGAVVFGMYCICTIPICMRAQCVPYELIRAQPKVWLEKYGTHNSSKHYVICNNNL